jgi:hypothetical protein
MRSTAESPSKNPFYFVVALATLLLVGLPAVLLVQNEPIDRGLLFGVRLLTSFSAAVIGGALPGFINLSMTPTAFITRAGGALALFVLTFLYVPAVLSEFDAKSWIGTSSAILGLVSLVLAGLTAVAAAYTTVRETKFFVIEVGFPALFLRKIRPAPPLRQVIERVLNKRSTA